MTCFVGTSSKERKRLPFLARLVKITVLEVRSGQVKLGIEAPPEVKVHREEIYARIQEENRKAAQRPPGTGTDPGKK